jgi:peptidoglycan/LPS O-acetylase OafA/YrhL
LRAIAVLSVVFFHLSPRLLPGGYLGVDIFFVLSGYLITSIIWREAQLGQFSVVRFYDRRVRRIMPALLFMLYVTAGVSMALLLPSDLIGFGKSVLATVAFVPNIYFWRDTNYFSPDAAQKPLLHVWSLGVEEQFYVLFPLLLLAFARWWRRGALPVIAALTAASLGANVAALMVGGESPAFFLLPTRAWELGMGSLLCLLPPGAAPRGKAAGITALMGAAVLAVSIVRPWSPYPFMPLAVLTVAAVALLIVAGEREVSPVHRALRFRPLVYLGLISYSLYLWHWPIFVFGRYYLVRELKASETATALVLMGAFSVVSWRFIERPFRNKSLSIGIVRYAAAGGAAVLAIAAAALILMDGMPRRLNAEAAIINQAVGSNYRCPVSAYIAFGRARACLMNLPSRDPRDADVVLLGNSHAQMYAPLWASLLAERGLTGLLVPLNACLPTVQVNLTVQCLNAARENLDEVAKLRRAGTVILGLTWGHAANALVDGGGHTADNRGNAALVGALDDLIERLRSAGKRAVLIGPIPEPGWDVASILSRQLAFGHPIDRPLFMTTADFTRRFGSAIAHFETRADISFVRPDRALCSAERCNYLLGGRSLYSDGSHIAEGELKLFRPLFADALAPMTAAGNQGEYECGALNYFHAIHALRRFGCCKNEPDPGSMASVIHSTTAPKMAPDVAAPITAWK